MISTRTKAEARIKKARARKLLIHNQDFQVLIHNQDFQPLKTPFKRDKAIPGNQTIGIPTLPTIPQRQLQRVKIHGTLNGWHQSLWILPTIRRTSFWILVAHSQFDQELQSEGSRHMRCIMALQQNFAFAMSLLCLPALRQKLVGKVVLFIFRQNHHVLPELICLRRATCLSCSHFRRCRIWVLHLN